MFRALLCSSSGGVLYKYNIWYRHCLWVTVQYTGYEKSPLVTCVLNSHPKTVTIPNVVLMQLSSWRWAQHRSKHVEECNKYIEIKNLCIKLLKKDYHYIWMHGQQNVIFYVLLTVHPCIIFFKWSQLGAHYFLVYLFQLLYMFRATVCPSSGELYLCNTGIFHSVWVAVWAASRDETRRPYSNPHRVKNSSVAQIQ